MRDAVIGIKLGRSHREPRSSQMTTEARGLCEGYLIDLSTCCKLSGA